MSNTTTKKLAEAFIRYQKETARANPHSRYIGPARNAQTPDENGYLPPVADHERALAGQQVDEIVTMMQPITERFSGEKELIAALTDLVEKLRLLVAQGEVKKQAQAPMPFRKRFIRVVGNPLPLRPARPNSLDLMVDDAASRVAVSKKYGAH